MSFRLQMLQVARLAPKVLGDESTALVASFLRSRIAEGSGFKDRAESPDLYYSVFGIEGLLALQAELPRASLTAWLSGYASGEGLDFVHLCCLARCWAALDKQALAPDQRAAMASRIEAFRAADGGYHVAKGKERGSAYGCLLASAAYEDLALVQPNVEGVHGCMDALICPDGGWTNEAMLPFANAPGTAAAMELYRRHGWAVPERCMQWLLGCAHEAGGFKAIPLAPIPDLLSTAVCLHALSGAGRDVSALQERCLDFVDSLWSAEGGFHGNWTDHTLDCEYTYYGLLALGHLA